MQRDSSDMPVSVPVGSSDAWAAQGTLSQRYHFRPHESMSPTEGDDDARHPLDASEPFLGVPDAGTRGYARGSVHAGVLGIALHFVYFLLQRWKAIALVVLAGIAAALFLFNLGRPEWRELAYYRVDPDVRVPVDALGQRVDVRPTHPIIPPKLNQCAGPGGRAVPLSPAAAHPTPPTHPAPLVGDYQMIGLDGGQCMTYRARYSMYTDEALNITYRLPDELLPDALAAAAHGDGAAAAVPMRNRTADAAALEEARRRVGYDPLHGLRKPADMDRWQWEEQLRMVLSTHNSRDKNTVFVPDWRALMDGCYRQRLTEREGNASAGASHAAPRPSEGGSHVLVDEVSVQYYRTNPSHKRTALVMRSYQGYPWREDDILNLRALISELSLNNPNTPYDIRILVEVKDPNLSVFTSEWDRYRVLVTSVPREFWGLVEFWNEKELEVLYAGLPGKFINNMIAQTSYRACLMALQKFWLDHQEYDYVYNWEMDVRYTGNYLDFLEGIEQYARREPLIPGMDKYETWFVRNVTDSETNWRGASTEVAGIGEEADLITLGPIFDPRGSGWYWTHDVQNYPLGWDTDRRASIGTNMRMSRGLLEAMNVVNAEAKKSLHCEAWPTTLVLHSQMERSEHHSFYPSAGFTYSLPLPFKGVFAPHPIYFRHEWDPSILHRLLNRPDFYKKKNENLHRDSSFYYHAQHAKEIYMGWKNQEDVCRAPSMLHPIKAVD
ncbi:hypothetical protein MSPP1_002541 [Malassezia sp. CBS 17886]|nr:hypothetical protein MSPP1_002541 [Malassezia sp. CBS 17886]